MNFKSTTLIIVIIFLTISGKLKAQDFWKKIEKENYIPKKEIYQKKNFPLKFELISLDTDELKNQLNSLAKETKKIINLPNSKGVLLQFEIKEASNFNTLLAAKFSMIKSYSAQGISDPTAVAKISMGTDGFHAVIFSGKENTIYIDPYSKDNKDYIVYRRSDLGANKNIFKCEVEQNSKKIVAQQNFERNIDDEKLRTFKLAMVCSGEYAQFHLNNQNVIDTAADIEKKAAVLSAINTSMTRINGVYEKDLGVRMELVANNDEIIFLDADKDNITDGAADAMIDEVQSICDAIIGNENYDIGHVFSVGGDGLAGLGVVCIEGAKARGVTGITTPIGDPYDIDYVSHEMGHQFGANHTQNNDCNRNNETAVEPGSASTIMGYAGICGPNVQNNSDDHFHAVNIAEMWATLQSSATCGVLTDIGNTAPTADAGLDYQIPKSTPFVLNGTDSNGTASLTYNWEQIDNEVATMPPLSSNTGGPMFRSLPSKVSSKRYMPDLSTVILGSTSSEWEVLPAVSRDLNFSFLVRDNYAGGGNSAIDNVKISVTDAEPFIVTSQNTEVTLYTGSSRTITWDKGSTDMAPINCQNVNIKLSLDGGLTYPIVLKSNTSNDGSEEVIIPNNATTTARIMVEAVENIFYNVNASNLTIDATTPTFLINSTPVNQSVCNFGNETAIYNLNLDFVNSFSESVSFTTTGAPQDANVTFSPSLINNDGTVVMTVSNLDGKTAGSYTITIQANSSSVTQNINVSLNLKGEIRNTLNLTYPSNSATNVSLTETLVWNADANASFYDIEVAIDPNFANVVYTGNIYTNSYTLANLSEDTTYYWRVKAKNNCSEGNYSNTYNFTTIACTICLSSGDTSSNIGITLVNFNTINNISVKDFDQDGVNEGYADYTVLKTTIKLNEVHALTVNTMTDGFNKVQVKAWVDWNQNCSFNDAGEEYDLGASFSVNDIPSGNSPLAITVPANALLGSTLFRVSVKYTNASAITFPTSCLENFEGEVEDYIIIVEDATTSIEDVVFEGFNLFPNPTIGEFKLNFKVENTTKVLVQLFDVNGRLIDEKKYYNTSLNFSKKIFFEKAAVGFYLLKVTNGDKQIFRKIIIK